MKKIFLMFGSLFFLVSCDPGSPYLSHSGICDGYADPAASLYNLPWTTGVAFSVTQANCGAGSHIGTQRYAYDINMSIGTQIKASRGGVVTELEEQFADGRGCSQLNYLKIRHSDGTIGQYLHLTQNGVQVNVGAVVNQGDNIALSGNSGCSTNPHLHFVVFDSEEKDSLPITFKNTSQNTRGLLYNKNYTAL